MVRKPVLLIFVALMSIKLCAEYYHVTDFFDYLKEEGVDTEIISGWELQYADQIRLGGNSNYGYQVVKTEACIYALRDDIFLDGIIGSSFLRIMIVIPLFYCTVSQIVIGYRYETVNKNKVFESCYINIFIDSKKGNDKFNFSSLDAKVNNEVVPYADKGDSYAPAIVPKLVSIPPIPN